MNAYRTGVGLFVEYYAKIHVEDVTKQDIINFISELRQ